jgi:hypothetical protein
MIESCFKNAVLSEYLIRDQKIMIFLLNSVLDVTSNFGKQDQIYYRKGNLGYLTKIALHLFSFIMSE